MRTPRVPNACRCAAMLAWLARLAMRLLAGTLNMPEPLVAASGSLVFAHVQAIETRAIRRLRPRRLSRRLKSWLP